MKLRIERKTFRRSGRGTVALIAFLLATSAILRLASGAGEALAQGAEKSGPESPSSSSDEPSPDASMEGMSKLLVALRAREAKVKEREADLEVRSKALTVVNDEITKRIVILENAEIELRATLALADGAAENDLARLTTVYENMKPKDAAALFETMEPGFAAGFLGRMRPDAAASVLAGLTPASAYSISVILASRNANVPKT